MLLGWRLALLAIGVFWAGALPVPAGDATGELVLDNGVLKLGMDLSTGGPISYLSLSGEDRNLVNVHDRGRYIQQSYYAGDSLDRRAEGQKEHWSPWTWNPIQVGDAYGNPAQVLEHRVRDGVAYVKNIPMLWDMKNEAAECVFETWVRLDGPTVHVRNKLTTHRTDDRWPVRARHQELPAVYTIADLPHLHTYLGDTPWTNGPLTIIENRGPPWEYWPNAKNPGQHEKWAALVDDDGWGLGVYNARTQLFVGGFSGTPGGGAEDASTGYISPLRTEELGKDSVYEYEYDLIVGTLAEIRAFVYDREDVGKGAKTP